MACAGCVCGVPRSELEAVDGMDTAAASAHEAAAEETKTKKIPGARVPEKGVLWEGRAGRGSPERRREERQELT